MKDEIIKILNSYLRESENHGNFIDECNIEDIASEIDKILPKKSNSFCNGCRFYTSCSVKMHA